MAKTEMFLRAIVSFIAIIVVAVITIQANRSFFDGLKGNASTLWQGDGSMEDPFLIHDLSDLILLQESVNSGMTYEGKYFLQVCDIDLGKDNVWTPIGIFGSGKYFFGIYDGGANKISNLNIIPSENNSGNNSGLFGVLGGQVRNLGIESGHIEGDFVGSIASHSTGNEAAIINCYNKASVSGSRRAGGICDNFSGGSIVNCVNYGEISGPQSAQIVSYDAEYVINVFPEDNAVTAGYQGFFANYIAGDDTVAEEVLNEGIYYLNTMEVFSRGEIKYWKR